MSATLATPSNEGGNNVIKSIAHRCTYGKGLCRKVEPEVPALTETIEDDDSVVDCCKKACSGVPAGNLRQQCENMCNMH